MIVPPFNLILLPARTISGIDPMLDFRSLAIGRLTRIGPQFLPFADVASQDVPLSRLLRLSLFQVSVGMALVLLIGTLNRVMIVELAVPAFLVGLMISIPLVFAPFRALIGFQSDMHRCALGWRRVPFIWKGTMLQFGGFAVMPFALLVLSGYGDAVTAPAWVGYASAAIAFLLVGAGVHMVQTVGLALATDLVPIEDQPKVVGLMYVMLLLGMILSALVFGALLVDYSPGRLIQVIQGAAVVTVVLNVIAMWKQEIRDPARMRLPATPDPAFSECWNLFAQSRGAMRRLAVIALGTMGFGMADVLLEPYGGQVLAMSVAGTTKLTAIFALGGLVGFAWASRVLTATAQRPNASDPIRVAVNGLLAGLPGLAAIIAAAPGHMPYLFVAGILMIGFGAGLFGHGTLTATIRLAPRELTGLALGAWGAVQATSAGLAIALAGAIRDVIFGLSGTHAIAVEMAYIPVFALEMAFLALALMAAYPLWREAGDGERYVAKPNGSTSLGLAHSSGRVS